MDVPHFDLENRSGFPMNHSSIFIKNVAKVDAPGWPGWCLRVMHLLFRQPIGREYGRLNYVLLRTFEVGDGITVSRRYLNVTLWLIDMGC